MTDAYLTIAGPGAGEFRDRGSKFLACAYPVSSEEEALAWVEHQRREHPKARHHCYAYRLGLDGARYRANDDGEPSGTAGRPILGQIDSFGLTNVVVVVVRYFGGTLLGTSGLINAYRAAAADALGSAETVERVVESVYALHFGYDMMGQVMSALERMGLPMLSQDFGERADVRIALRRGEAAVRLVELRARIAGVSLDEAESMDIVPGVTIEYIGDRD